MVSCGTSSLTQSNWASSAVMPSTGFESVNSFSRNRSSIFEPNLIGGVVVLQSQAGVKTPGNEWNGKLCCIAQSRAVLTSRVTTMTAIPYYAWANRALAWMLAWLRAQA
jgi:DUF1680 family protein